MEAVVIVLGVALAYWLGYKVGRREIIKALGVPDGYVITSVHFAKQK